MCCIIEPMEAGSTPFSNGINVQWLQGRKANVLAIANQRLQNNPNDIAGLILTMQYQMAFFDLTDFSTSANKVITVGANINTPNFANAYPGLKASLQYLLQNLPTYTTQQIQTEAAKGNIAGKPMDFLYVLQAAESDGLIH